MINYKENLDIKSIAEHVEILNEEMGNVQNDIRWIKKIMWYMAGVMSAILLAAVKIVFLGI